MQSETRTTAAGMARSILAVLALLLAAAQSPAATNYYVSTTGDDTNSGLSQDDAFKTLLAAYSAAQDGDTIRILAGSYTDLTVTANPSDANVDYLAVVTKAVQILGDDPDTTILHCVNADGSTRRRGGVWLANANALLAGVTIRDSNNKYSTGDGLWTIGAALHIVSGVASNCVIRDNVGEGNNGRQPPVYLNGVNSLLTDSVVRDNIQGPWGKGAGGVYITGGAKMTRCRIIRNFGGDVTRGNGIYIVHGYVRDCVIAGNSGLNTLNSSDQNAGVVMSEGLLERCVILCNTNALPNASYSLQAGGLLVSGSYPAVVRNCLVAGNVVRAPNGAVAGGVLVRHAKAAVSHLTVADNLSVIGANGLRLDAGSVSNSIVHGNGGRDVVVTGGTLDRSCFPEAAQLGGAGNLALDPLLMNTDLAAPATSALTSTFTLSRASPCRDAVTNGYAVAADDLTGSARPIGDAPDMGCHELPGITPGALVASFSLPSRGILAGRDVTLTARLEGDDTTIGTLVWHVSDGSTTTIYATTTAALTLPAPPAGWYEVTLFATNAAGVGAAAAADAFVARPATTYVSTTGSAIWPYDSEDKAATSLRDAVGAVYGATDFTGTVHIASGSYNSMEYDTASGYSRLAAVSRPIRLVGADDPADIVLSYNVTGSTDFGGGIVLNHPGASLCGVTLTGSARSIDNRWENGMALHINAGLASNCVICGAVPNGTHIRPPVRIQGGLMTHCEVRDNYSAGLWGRGSCGVYLSDGEIRRSRIERNGIRNSNSDQARANGLYMTSGTVRDSVIAGNFGGHNHANSGAAGVRMDGGLIERCVIQCNTNSTFAKKQAPGGILVNGTATVRNCLIADNISATSDSDTAGGIYIQNAGGVVEHATLYNNLAASGAGGLADNKGAVVRGSIIAGNAGVANVTAVAGTTFLYSCFPEAGGAYTGTGCISADPQLEAPATAGLVGLDAPSGYAISRASPCRDAVTGGAAWVADDLLGSPRPLDGATTGDYPDMGCYELAAAGDDEVFAAFSASRQHAYLPCEITFTGMLEGGDTTFGPSAWLVENTTLGTSSRIATPAGILVLANPAPGTYDVTLYATNSQGIGADAYPIVGVLTVQPTDTHVSTNGLHIWPYDTPANAATNLFEAVGAVYGATDYTGTVHVAAGDYAPLQLATAANGFSYLATLDKPVSVIGSDDPAATILRFHSPNAGGGLYVANEAALVAGLTLSGKTTSAGSDAYHLGQAFQLTHGTVSNCVVRGCGDLGQHTQPPVVIQGGLMVDCAIRDNLHPANAHGFGRAGLGVYIMGGEMRRCDISGNSIPYARADHLCAGGVYQTGGIVRDCTITNNYGARWVNYNPVAGGARVDGGLMERCIIAGNINGSYTNNNANIDSSAWLKDSAGGLLVNGAAIVRNCLVAGNCATNPLSPSLDTAAGLVLTASASGAAVTNITVADNRHLTQGDQRAAYIAAGRLCNAILWGNGTASDVRQTGGTITYTCLASATTGDGSGNLASNPAFKNAAAGDYRLLLASPCVDAGCDAGWTADDLDLAGNPRILGKRIDIGAYENTATSGTMLMLR